MVLKHAHPGPPAEGHVGLNPTIVVLKLVSLFTWVTLVTLSQSNRSGFEIGTAAVGRTPNRRSQSNRSGFEIDWKAQASSNHNGLNPTVVVLKSHGNCVVVALLDVSIQP